MNLLDNLDPSPTADSIYYADLFRIAGRCWMIMGSGKSDAARIASEKDRAADLARDSVALIRDGDVLHGRYDLGALPKDPARREEVCPVRRLDVVAASRRPRRRTRRALWNWSSPRTTSSGCSLRIVPIPGCAS